jgi:hypothetical protein
VGALWEVRVSCRRTCGTLLALSTYVAETTGSAVLTSHVIVGAPANTVCHQGRHCRGAHETPRGRAQSSKRYTGISRRRVVVPVESPACTDESPRRASLASRFRSFSSRHWAFSVFLAASICFARTRCTFPGVGVHATSASYRRTDLSLFSRMSVLLIAVSRLQLFGLRGQGVHVALGDAVLTRGDHAEQQVQATRRVCSGQRDLPSRMVLGYQPEQRAGPPSSRSLLVGVLGSPLGDNAQRVGISAHGVTSTLVVAFQHRAKQARPGPCTGTSWKRASHDVRAGRTSAAGTVTVVWVTKPSAVSHRSARLTVSSTIGTGAGDLGCLGLYLVGAVHVALVGEFAVDLEARAVTGDGIARGLGDAHSGLAVGDRPHASGAGRVVGGGRADFGGCFHGACGVVERRTVNTKGFSGLRTPDKRAGAVAGRFAGIAAAVAQNGRRADLESGASHAPGPG